MNRLKKAKSNIGKSFTEFANEGFKKIFEQIDQLGIKSGVDKMGLDKFINQCALFAAGSGAISGSGGAITMAVGMPLDLINLITQQFRATMAITYYYKGSYKINFDEFIDILGRSLKVDAGVTVTKSVLEGIAEKLMVNIGSRTAEMLVPVAGAIIGGTANYLFIKRMSESVKKMQPQYFTESAPIV